MTEPFLGEVRPFAFDFPPAGWAFCDGAVLSIQQNQALYTILGITYGGNGTTTFNLPDLRGRVPIHCGPGFDLGKASGMETVTLSENEIPSHTHTVRANSGTADKPGPGGNTWAAVGGYSSAAPNVKMGLTALAPNSGGQGHENRQPYLVVNFCIALTGIYPARD